MKKARFLSIIALVLVSVMLMTAGGTAALAADQTVTITYCNFNSSGG